MNRRLSPQKAQELKSRAQVSEALSGWLCNSLADDLGEDFLVSIYDDGHSTGLTFQLQLKSSSNLEALRAKRNAGHIRYSLEVKDLTHWENSAPPVVVAVWDVVGRLGYWQDVPRLIQALDKSNRTWRRRKHVTVRIPTTNTLDAVGRPALRHRIGSLSLPSLSQGKRLTITPTFSFPNTSEGRAKARALRRAIEQGGRATINREHIRQVIMSPWWERIFGTMRPDKFIIKPSRTDVHLPVVLESIGPSGLERISVDLIRIKAGTRQLTFENTSPADPLIITLLVHLSAARAKQPAKVTQLHLSMRFAYPHSLVACAHAQTRLFSILLAGGRLRLVTLDGHTIAHPTFDHAALPPLSRLRAWEPLLASLAFIESYLGYHRFTLVADVRKEDLETTARLYRICSTQSEMATISPTFSLRALRLRSSAPPSFTATMPSQDLELFGLRIPTGPIELEAIDPRTLITQLARAKRRGKTRLHIPDIPVKLTYNAWPRTASPLGTTS